ncbi:MAG TPA: hypothetical protein VK766_00935 [Cytophagaceae bacterium]|jgi:hypothetical protein|nr:hypothetical protein [Cytophagaceae bacterium]
MNSNYVSSLDKIKPVLNILLFFSGLVMIIVSMIDNGPSAKIFVIMGVFIMSFSIQNLFTNGVEFDFEKRRYRIYKDILSLKIGKWYSLSGFDRIVFREFSYIIKSSKGIPDRRKQTDYQIYLTGKTKKSVKLYVYKERDEAWNAANQLADNLGYELKAVYN